MATANSLVELEQMLLAQMELAVMDFQTQSLDFMEKEIEAFYTNTPAGKPVLYQRTYKLRDIPEASDLTSLTTGRMMTTTGSVYFDQSYTYTTGKNPSMTDVLNLTNFDTHKSSVGYLRSAVGDLGFWQRSIADMKGIFKKTLKAYFKK